MSCLLKSSKFLIYVDFFDIVGFVMIMVKGCMNWNLFFMFFDNIFFFKEVRYWEGGVKFWGGGGGGVKFWWEYGFVIWGYGLVIWGYGLDIWGYGLLFLWVVCKCFFRLLGCENFFW